MNEETQASDTLAPPADEWAVEGVISGQECKPPRVTVYGPHGVGKTTFASRFPNPILLRTEDGIGSLSIPRFPHVATKYEHVQRACGSLYERRHDRQTLILDSLDWLEPIIWAETCRREGQSDIEAFGYGKGYLFAEAVWAEFLEGLDFIREQRGMSIVLIAHSDITRYTSPETEPYDRHALKLHKLASALVAEWSDVLGYAHWETHTTSTDLGFKKKATRGIGSGNRLLAVEERPAYHAKNRFSLPPIVPLDTADFLTRLAARYDVPAEEPTTAAPAA